MKQKVIKDSRNAGKTTIQFNLVGLVVFSVALVVVGALVAHSLAMSRAKPGGNQTGSSRVSSGLDHATTNLPPWGELLTYDMELEQPEEYVGFELATNRVATWVFNGMTADKVRELMASCGLPAKEISHALSPQLATATGSGVVIKPDEELIFSLSPQTRSKLYGQLAQDEVNHYMKFPFCYPGQTIDTLFNANDTADKNALAVVKKLLYPRGDAQCFSDYEWVMQHLPSEETRMSLVKALSRQSAVLVRVRIRPETDIDRLLGYWGSAPGVRFKDVRPLIESVRRMQDGGTISLLYLLPQFARQRLYTFPLPSKPGDTAMDCHWSTMNFFNESPDDRFSDTTFTSKYIGDHYYQIAKPTAYGDIIFLLDEKGVAIHSGVYIAADIIFTKNGNNFAQPWMLMHLKDLMTRYETLDHPPRMVVYRNKDD